MVSSMQLFRNAFQTMDLEEFLRLLFPPAWMGVAARILETGATMSPDAIPWAPGWSPIPAIFRPRPVPEDEIGGAPPSLEVYVQSCLFRVHICIHQLWGLPAPDPNFSHQSFQVFKRVRMCGAIAAFTLTEFEFARHLLASFPDIRPILHAMNVLPLREFHGPMALLPISQIAARLLRFSTQSNGRHNWAAASDTAARFSNDFLWRMLRDSKEVDHNWRVMQSLGWTPPPDLPVVRYDPITEDTDLLKWMVEDFFSLIHTNPTPDRGLVAFNRLRRSAVSLPGGWGELKKEHGGQ